jgi:hypothetical protein
MGITKLEQAEDSYTPAPILKTLANDESWEVREAVANNHHVLSTTLDKLANDESDFVRYAVSLNNNTSPQTLTMLTDDTNSDIKCNIAKHPNASARILTMLALNGDESVLKAVLNNHKTPENAIEIIKKKLS